MNILTDTEAHNCSVNLLLCTAREAKISIIHVRESTSKLLKCRKFTV
jgi:hypothetical protein